MTSYKKDQRTINIEKIEYSADGKPFKITADHFIYKRRSDTSNSQFAYFTCINARKQKKDKHNTKAFCPAVIKIQLPYPKEIKECIFVGPLHSEDCLTAIEEKEQEPKNYSEQVEIREAKQKVDDKIKNLLTNSPNVTVEQINDALMADESLKQGLFPSKEKLNEIIRKWKKDNLIQAKDAVLNKYQFSAIGTSFLRANLSFTINEHQKMDCIIWASDYMVTKMRNTDHFYLDGTFSVCPPSYSQLLTILVVDEATQLRKPACHILLNNKSEAAYKFVFSNFKLLLLNNYIRPLKLKSVTIDFESALQNSFNEFFPEVRIIGCLFHFKFNLQK